MLRASVPDYHGFSAYFVASSVAARFLQPQVSGIGVSPPGQGGTGVFRIDHDEKFNQTTHLQYKWKRGLWLGFNWRYGQRFGGGGGAVRRWSESRGRVGTDGGPAVPVGIVLRERVCNAADAHPFEPGRESVFGFAVWEQIPEDSGRKTTTTIRRAWRHGTCSTSRWGMTICSVGTTTSGVCSSR
jgi:hypothetical protein